METVDGLIAAARAGAPGAVDRLFSLTYAELRDLAHRRLRRSASITVLDTTVLVHECYLRLAKLGRFTSVDRAFFLGYAARAMRSIVIDLLRQRAAERHGGDALRVTLDQERIADSAEPEDQLLRVNDALEELGHLDPRLVQVVELKYFGGLTFQELADCLGITERTARRDWEKARLLLHASLSP
jgi:RNA polymerase sigma factor (TIGR02999 family)